MKKTKKTSRFKQEQNDEQFARKVAGQLVICTVMCIVVLINSKLSNPVSVQINNGIKHYLCVSVDFDKVINTARVYFENFVNNGQSVPVNSGNAMNSEDDKQ